MRSRTSWPPRTTTSTCCTGRASRAWAPPTSPGFRWGLAEGFDVLVEMDADGSHQPEELPKLLEALATGADLAIGSRWVPGGKVVNWPASRELLSRGANIYTRIMLGLPVRDATGGLPRLPGGDAGEDRPGRRRSPRATASRWTSRCAPSRSGLRVTEVPDHVRRPHHRLEQDEPGHRDGGAVAGHRVGRARPAPPGCAASGVSPEPGTAAGTLSISGPGLGPVVRSALP